MQRIVVVGSTGSGKSIFAGALARRLDVPHVQLDALHWDPGWAAASPEVFRARVATALPPDGAWVVDGNYDRVRDISWGRADTVLWLDYPLPLVFWRLARRTVRRGLTRAELYNGNRESLWRNLFTRESLFLWLLQTHGRYRRAYPTVFTQPGYAHLKVERFRHPGQARAWMAEP
jgi:adenylate kinase family enzyme